MDLFVADSSANLSGKEEKKKAGKRNVKPRKLTDLEMNIQFLEQKGSLVPIEQIMLDNYKERQALLTGYLGKEKESNIAENTTTENDNSSEHTPVESTSLSIRKKQAFPSAFVIFKREKVLQFKKENPNEKIDKDFCVDIWKKMTSAEKKVYHDEAALEKDKLGGEFRKDIKLKSMSEAEKKESKKQSNLKRKILLQDEKEKKDNREKDCNKKYSEIIRKREEKLKALKSRGVMLSSSISEKRVENSIIMKLLKEKEFQNASVKEKYAVLYKIHKNCSN